MLNIIENFPILFDSKEKVKELRNLILNLAIQGKLVPQDPGDEPASVLLQRIEAEKKRLVKEKTIKKTKPLPPIGEDEIPFEIPEDWEWTRLGTISNYGISETVVPEKIQDTEWVLELEDIEKESSIVVQKVLNAKRKAKSNKNRFYTGDILYGKLRPYLKKVIVAEEPGVCTTEIIPFRGYNDIVSKYIMYYLKSPYIDSYVNNITHGMSMPRLGTDKARMLLFQLPPLTEQHRIVQKVDELIVLCDQLEKALEKKAQSKELASKSISNLIQKSENKEQLKANLTLLINMFKEVYSTKANIKDLRDTILQLAIQGKLVPQDPNDEPACVLLENIKKENKGKKSKPFKEITISEIPFEIPQNWVWTRLGAIINKLTDGAHHTPTYTKTGVPFLSVKDISSGKINFTNTKFISKEEHEELYKRCNPEKGDLLLTKVGSTGIPVVVDTDREFSLFVSVALIKFNQNLINGQYLKYLFESPLLKQYSQNNTRGIGNKNLVLKHIEIAPIPLPPLLEQNRIVQKVDELMALCDELENYIEATVHHSHNLMKSIIKTAI